jgi:hypothetical protein
MSVTHEKVLELLKKHTKHDAILMIQGDPVLAYDVIAIGIDKILSVHRRRQRREIKQEISPTYTIEARAVRFSPETMQRIQSHTVRLVSDWYIGGLALGDLTKEQLLAEAEKEKRAGTGHLVNARIYEILAAPLHEGQRMRTHWSEERAKAAVAEVREEPLTAGP